jgi:hypothetical protein
MRYLPLMCLSNLYYWFRVGGEATHSTYNIWLTKIPLQIDRYYPRLPSVSQITLRPLLHAKISTNNIAIGLVRVRKIRFQPTKNTFSSNLMLRLSLPVSACLLRASVALRQTHPNWFRTVLVSLSAVLRRIRWRKIMCRLERRPDLESGEGDPFPSSNKFLCRLERRGPDLEEAIPPWVRRGCAHQADETMAAARAAGSQAGVGRRDGWRCGSG